MSSQRVRLRIPTFENHPWAEIALYYVKALHEGGIPLRVLSYTGLPNLMIHTSKWYPYADLFRVPSELPETDRVHMVIGPGEQLERWWTRGAATIALTASIPKFKEAHLRAAKDYDHLLTISEAHQVELERLGLKPKVVRPEHIAGFLRELL